MKKMLIAALVGGLLLFAWGFVSHMLLPLGHMGLSVLPPAAEAGVIGGLKGNLTEPGLYFFPGVDNWPSPSDADLETQDAKAKSGPAGLMVVEPVGSGMSNFAWQLVKELISNFVCALAMAVVLMHVPKSMGFLRRVGVGTLLGAYGAMDIEASYNTFHHFPGSYFSAQSIIAIGGACVAAIGVAALTDAPE